MLGSVNLLARDLVSWSAVCKTCEKENLYHGCKRLRSRYKYMLHYTAFLSITGRSYVTCTIQNHISGVSHFYRLFGFPLCGAIPILFS